MNNTELRLAESMYRQLRTIIGGEVLRLKENTRKRKEYNNNRAEIIKRNSEYKKINKGVVKEHTAKYYYKTIYGDLADIARLKNKITKGLSNEKNS